MSADERALRVERWTIKRTTCPDCGNPITECSDPERVWYPYRRICYATMEREAADAAYQALHGEGAGWHDGSFTSWRGDRSESHPYAASSGVSIGVANRDLAPWDLFTTERDASPVASVAEQAPGKQDDPDAGGDDGQDADQE